MGIKKLSVLLIAVLAVFASPLLSMQSAGAFPLQSRVVSTNPADNTPHVVDGNINKFALMGNTMYAGGTINTVREQGRATVFTRHNIMAFNPATGAVLPFAPNINGQVWSIQPGASGTTMWIAGDFTSVDGIAARGLVKYDLVNNRVMTAFNARLNHEATNVQTVHGQIVVAGKFSSAGGVARKALASLDPITGNATPYINLNINGRVADNSGPTLIYRFSMNPAANRIVMIGNFTSVAGQSRSRVAMINVSPGSTSLAPFNDIRFYAACHSSLPVYFRDVDWSPDGSYFALVSTGGWGASPLCDTTSRWDDFVNNSGPTWINYTGGDTLHSVAVTGPAVYVGGHQRWLDNPEGQDFAGPGAVSRPGIGAIHPVTGKALSWNPTRNRGVGAKELYPTYAAGIEGLWVGSDTDRIGGEYHESIGFFPL